MTRWLTHLLALALFVSALTACYTDTATPPLCIGAQCQAAPSDGGE